MSLGSETVYLLYYQSFIQISILSKFQLVFVLFGGIPVNLLVELFIEIGSNLCFKSGHLKSI